MPGCKLFGSCPGIFVCSAILIILIEYGIINTNRDGNLTILLERGVFG